MQLVQAFFQNENIVIATCIAFACIAILIFRVLSPKRIYFVRHGETILNAAHIRQDNVGGLSDLGREQVQATAVRLSKMHITHLYVSPYERTIETAEIINKYLRVPVTYTKLLVERRNPSQIVGKKYDDLEVEKIINQIDLTGHGASFRFSDEENFEDLEKRAEILLRYLALRPHKAIACITHGIFLKMVLAYITHGKELTPLTLATLTYLTKVDNAGITLVTYSPWKTFLGKKAWDIVVFNDVSKV